MSCSPTTARYEMNRRLDALSSSDSVGCNHPIVSEHHPNKDAALIATATDAGWATAPVGAQQTRKCSSSSSSGCDRGGHREPANSGAIDATHFLPSAPRRQLRSSRRREQQLIRRCAKAGATARAVRRVRRVVFDDSPPTAALTTSSRRQEKRWST